MAEYQPSLATVRVPDSFWVSLRYFNVYRIAVVAVFLGTALFYHDELPIGQHNLPLFLYACGAYLLVACVFQAAMFLLRERFNLQLSLHVCADILAITVLMYASGGIKSGLGVMLLISLTGAALVAPRRLTYLYAALAAIAALLEQGYWVLVFDWPTSNFLQPGLLSIGYFATAGITSQLAQRVVANETLARQRGRALQSQQRVNQLVLADMQDGVLVLDQSGRVAQANPQVARLLGVERLHPRGNRPLGFLAQWCGRARPGTSRDAGCHRPGKGHAVEVYRCRHRRGVYGGLRRGPDPAARAGAAAQACSAGPTHGEHRA
ncbi:MAG: PAS domain-containing protein [Proteobacteria bacterium]|nr:PAS domain-containing protein [Pseudomonadota bacterium]